MKNGIKNTKGKRNIFKIVALAVVSMLAVLFINSLIVELLWNCLMPAIFNIAKITYIDAMGLIVLFNAMIVSSRVRQ